MTVDKVRVGIVGLGGIARGQHIPGYLLCENVELAAFCDLNEETLRAAGEQYGVSRLTTDYRELAADEELEALAARYRAECTRASAFTIEIITGRPPRVLNYLEADYWDVFPNARASEFARFERLVRRGRPYTGTMVCVERGADVPAEYQAALKAQQLYDVERSVAYCRDALGMGA